MKCRIYDNHTVLHGNLREIDALSLHVTACINIYTHIVFVFDIRFCTSIRYSFVPYFRDSHSLWFHGY